MKQQLEEEAKLIKTETEASNEKMAQVLAKVTS